MALEMPARVNMEPVAMVLPNLLLHLWQQLRQV